MSGFATDPFRIAVLFDVAHEPLGGRVHSADSVIRPRPCRHLPKSPRFLLRQVQAIDASTGSLFDQNYLPICRELGGVPGEDLAIPDGASFRQCIRSLNVIGCDTSLPPR